VAVVFEKNGDGDGRSVPEEVGLVLYRILQESLNNAKKHARAEEVEIAPDLQPDRVILEVRDDGVGFEVPAHLGLIGMWERAAQVGGSFDVESQPGQGTRVLVGIPLSPS
jgi:signal transduction histidine kinase